jgi:hypothetical protein
MIELIDAHGTQTCAVQGRQMDITSHESVLAALENLASRFSQKEKIQGMDDNLVSWALGETGMVNTFLFCNSYENNEQLALAEQQERNSVMELGVPEEVLWIHGVAPAGKLEGVIRLIYENFNGISNKLSNNNKVEKA